MWHIEIYWNWKNNNINQCMNSGWLDIDTSIDILIRKINACHITSSYEKWNSIQIYSLIPIRPAMGKVKNIGSVLYYPGWKPTYILNGRVLTEIISKANYWWETDSAHVTWGIVAKISEKRVNDHLKFLQGKWRNPVP